MSEFSVGPNDTTYKFYMEFGMERLRPSIWRRLWFLVSYVPRYLITGSVEVP